MTVQNEVENKLISIDRENQKLRELVERQFKGHRNSEEIDKMKGQV